MSDINSGSIEINITRNRETARAITLQLIRVGKRHCPVLHLDRSGNTGIDLTFNKKMT